MRSYNNVYYMDGRRYSACYLEDESLQSSEYYANLSHNAPYWIGREERWNHNILRPPVGMQSAQASHKWERAGLFFLRLVRQEPVRHFVGPQS